jgi:hypothetical protein
MNGNVHTHKAKNALRRFVFISYPILLLICLLCITYILKQGPRLTAEERADMIAEMKYESSTVAELMNSLQAYFDDHGKYPDSLGDLVPKYLDRIKPHKRGGQKEWIYSRDENGSFVLGIGYESYCGLSYPVVYNFVDRGWRRKN